MLTTLEGAGLLGLGATLAFIWVIWRQGSRDQKRHDELVGEIQNIRRFAYGIVQQRVKLERDAEKFESRISEIERRLGIGRESIAE